MVIGYLIGMATTLIEAKLFLVLKLETYCRRTLRVVCTFFGPMALGPFTNGYPKMPPQPIKFRIRKVRKRRPQPWVVEMSSKGICSRILGARAESWQQVIDTLVKRGWLN